MSAAVIRHLGTQSKAVTFVAGLCVLEECLCQAHATLDLFGDTEPWGTMYTPENAWLPDQATLDNTST